MYSLCTRGGGAVGSRALLVVSITGVIGCGSATMVTSPGGSSSPYGPVNQGRRPGLIKYLNQGASSVIESRRSDAYEQMNRACGGRYRIDAEGPRSEGGVVIVSGNTATAMDSQYWYIQFSCVRG